MHSKLRIGLVGAGGIVLARHLPALRSMPGVEITAVCNASYASSERFCRENLPHATPVKHWAELLALPGLDIVWIAAPPYMHAPVTISALEAGRHVFCQARMAMNLDEAREMLATARKFPHLVTMLCPPPQGMRGDALMRRILAGEVDGARIGRPHQVRLQSFTAAFLNPAAPAHWRQRAELSGLNVQTLGIYAEVLQRWLGPIRAVTARAKTLHPVRGGYRVEIPDMLTVLAEFENGAEGVLEFSAVTPFAPQDSVEIYGDKGALYYNFATDEIRVGTLETSAPAPSAEPVTFGPASETAALRTLEIPPELQGEWTVEQDFIAAVKAQTAHPSSSLTTLRPHPTFEDGVAYMRVVQAVADSVAAQCRVEVAG